MTSEPGVLGGTPERPARFFTGPEEFRAWLELHHATATELWMGLRKKHVADRGLTWEQAVPEALCYGWIDSVSQRIDEDTRRQRWTPRRPGSHWSSVNIDHVERLIAEDRMTPAGMAVFEQRRPDRCGVYSYERAESDQLPPQFAAVLAADPAAQAFWEQATATYRRVCVTWVTTAKREETRRARLATLVEDCAHGRLVKPQRYGAPPRWLERASAAAEQARRSR